MKRRQMESSLYLPRRTIHPQGHVFWTLQLTSHLPENDE
jgi:hypothetical protein